MPATPEAIAKYTNDGVVLTASDPAIRTAHIDAQENGDAELEMFYINPAHAQVILDERFAILSQISAIHEGVEVDDVLGLGVTIPIAPTVPCAQLIDEGRSIDEVVRTRAFAYEGETDRYSVEVVQ